MEILIAILCYFNMLTYQNAGMTPEQVNQIIMGNQTTVEYYYQNTDQLVAARNTFDRAEDGRSGR